MVPIPTPNNESRCVWEHQIKAQKVISKLVLFGIILYLQFILLIITNCDTYQNIFPKIPGPHERSSSSLTFHFKTLLLWDLQNKSPLILLAQKAGSWSHLSTDLPWPYRTAYHLLFSDWGSTEFEWLLERIWSVAVQPLSVGYLWRNVQ